jgi:hypothetical protein
MRTTTRILAALLFGVVAQAHDLITTNITFSREIARIIYAHCASCHHEGGMAFSLMTYAEARPWAVAIKEEALQRRMPPWGAIKGFGEFRNDQGLTSEQMELIVAWVDGGVPEGDAVNLPPPPKSFERPHYDHPQGEIRVSGDFKLDRPFRLDGLWPQSLPEKASLQITAELPDGSVEPLLWLLDYKPQFGHPFLLRQPLDLPRGTVIRGIPAGASIALLPAPPAEASAAP